MEWHQTFIRLTRDFSQIFPTGQDSTFTDAAAVIQECELSYYNHGHTENPYTLDDPRHTIWATHALVIFERIKARCEPIDAEFEVAKGCEVLPFPVPPGEEEPQKEAARLIRWSGGDVYV